MIVYNHNLSKAFTLSSSLLNQTRFVLVYAVSIFFFSSSLLLIPVFCVCLLLSLYSLVWELWTPISKQCHSGSVWRVTWAHPEFGQVLATCSFDRTVAVWEEQGNGRLLLWVFIAVDALALFQLGIRKDQLRLQQKLTGWVDVFILTNVTVACTCW